MATVDAYARRYLHRKARQTAGPRRSQFPSGTFNPILNSMAWTVAYWAEDPLWANPGNGNPVSTWREGKGSGNALVQATGANQPIFTTASATFNNRSTLTLDGVNDSLVTGSTFGPLGQVYATILICRQTSTVGATDRVFCDGAAVGHEMAFTQTATTGIMRAVGSVSAPSTTAWPANTTPHHAECSFNGALSQVIVGPASSLCSGNIGANTANGLTLGCNQAQALFTPLEVAFVGVIPTYATADANYTLFTNWATSYYGLTEDLTMPQLITVRRDVRFRLDEANYRQWTDDELTNWINEACRDIARRAEVLETSATLAIVAGTAEYTLSGDVVRVYRATWTPTGSSQQYPLGYQDFNSMDSVGYSVSTASGYPSVFTLWGYAPNLKMTLYPKPSVAGTVTYWYYKYPVDAVGDGDNVDVPNGWQDMVALYCEYVALRKDADPRWTDAKQLYEAAIMDMIDRTRRWSDQAGAIQNGSNWLPGWLYQGDY